MAVPAVYVAVACGSGTDAALSPFAETIGYVPPQEAETAFYTETGSYAKAA